jgi:hypothetical protein
VRISSEPARRHIAEMCWSPEVCCLPGPEACVPLSRAHHRVQGPHKKVCWWMAGLLVATSASRRKGGGGSMKGDSIMRRRTGPGSATLLLIF